MDYYKKSISNIIYVFNNSTTYKDGSLVILKRNMLKVFIALEMMHNINKQLPYDYSVTVTEFISIANTIANMFVLERQTFFSPSLYKTCKVKEFNKRIEELNNLVRI